MVEEKAGSSYEFTEEQNNELAGFNLLMRLFAYTLFLGGAFQALFICVYAATTSARGDIGVSTMPLMASTLAGIVAMYIALSLKSAAQDVASIIGTEGNDVRHLMRAFKRLTTFFRFAGASVWLLAAAVALALFFGIQSPSGG